MNAADPAAPTPDEPSSQSWRSLRRLLWPASILLLLLIPGWPVLEQYGAEARELSQRIVFWILGTAIGFSLAWLVVRLIEVMVWGLLERRLESPIPRLLKDLVVALVFVVAGITIVGLVFRRDVTGLWVSSGVLGIIIGFAVRGTIADVFSGVALNVDRSFRVGDWIEIHCRGVDDMRGRVLEVNWRATRMQTVDNTVVIVPNSLIAASVLINLSLPEPRSRFEQTFCLEFGVPTDRVLRILTAGARAAKGPLTEPPPKAFVHRVTEVGVEYKVRYWLDPVTVSPRSGRHLVTSSILQHLYHAGISLAYPKHDLYLARMPVRQLDHGRDRRQLLRRVDLFAALQPEEMDQLALAAQERQINAGEAIVRQHDAGASMFVVVEGLLDVCKDGDGPGQTVHVVELSPGDFFGEMSLLTGAPRAATVLAVTETIVFEIGAEAINDLLARRPELAWHLAEVAANRQRALAAATHEAPTVETPGERRLTHQILEGMKSFFSGLRGKLTRI